MGEMAFLLGHLDHFVADGPLVVARLVPIGFELELGRMEQIRRRWLGQREGRRSWQRRREAQQPTLLTL